MSQYGRDFINKGGEKGEDERRDGNPKFIHLLDATRKEVTPQRGRGRWPEIQQGLEMDAAALPLSCIVAGQT